MENSSLPLQGSFARPFALEWVEAWNSHDLDRILALGREHNPLAVIRIRGVIVKTGGGKEFVLAGAIGIGNVESGFRRTDAIHQHDIRRHR
jgi:hypothetical protein